MGQRPAKDRFMPSVYVFPGGRVDPEDAEGEVLQPLSTRESQLLAESSSGRDPERLAVAAVRETYEETGLLIGERRGGRVLPDLGCLAYLARAITPAESPIRYNARFFLADASHAK